MLALEGLPFHVPRRMLVGRRDFGNDRYTNGIERGSVCCSHTEREPIDEWLIGEAWGMFRTLVMNLIVCRTTDTGWRGWYVCSWK